MEASQILRVVEVTARRDAFHRLAGAVITEIERGARGWVHPGPEALAATTTPSSATEVCWLNETVRSWVPAGVLTEVAADPRVRGLDLPRRIMPELDVSAVSVGAPAYRLQHQLSGRGVLVGVIDSEVASLHPALRGRVVQKHNYSHENWGNPDAHGTAVAGIIAGRGAAVGGWDGIAPDATIYNYKVLATSRLLNADDFGGALAIQQALEDGVHIANCSWGAGPVGQTKSREARACDAAWAMGLMIVKSAGNRGPGPSTFTTPADADGVIVVGATDRKGLALQDYSSRGPLPGGRRAKLLLCPGGAPERGIGSCTVAGGFDDCGHGTSYAAPHVAGLLALLLEQDRDASPDDLRQRLFASCRRLPGESDEAQGAGFLSL